MIKLLLMSIALFFTLTSIKAQMLNPNIDSSEEPFCYFSQPTDVIGVMDGREGTLVSPEGYFYTGSGELVFFYGNPFIPVHQRVKTLYKGYLPVIQYQFDHEKVRYKVNAFAATLDGKPESPLINFIRVTLQNTADKKRTAFWGAGIRYQNNANTDWEVGDNRFGRPVPSEILGQFEQLGDTFSLEWNYEFRDNAFLRDGRLVYQFPLDPNLEKMMTMKMGYNEPPDDNPGQRPVLPTTPVGIVKYKISLNPGEEKSLVFKMPYLTLPLKSASIIAAANYETYLKNTESFWQNILQEGTQISVSEDKVNNTFKANLIYNLIARDKIDGNYIQKVNEFQYDAFWLRDAAYIAYMYDLTGYSDIAGQVLDFFPRWQQEDGNFVSHGGQYDGWGQVLWIYGRHFRMTGDLKFARKVYPSVMKAFNWLQKARKDDPLHIMPVTTPGDNENITGHVTGHNFWALAGLKNAVTLAKALGKKEDADRFQSEYDDFRDTLHGHLDKITERTGGYITPGMDDSGGQDWGNMMAVYPEQIFDPHHPWVTATLNTTRGKYQEGIMTYGDGRWLHHYITMKNTETELIRDEQQQVLEEFYAVLLHTSATHAGFEFTIFPWGDRDFAMNLSPHGWFAAEFRTLLRNMMVREENNELHLLSCISPEWVKNGDEIKVKNAVTEFGMLDFIFASKKDKAIFTLDTRFKKIPGKMVLHLPFFMKTLSITADGKAMTISQKSVVLPANTREVVLDWQPDKDAPKFSYHQAVEDYKREYRRRYEIFNEEGTRGIEVQ